MKHHYELQPGAWWAKQISFDWDDETNEISSVSGVDATEKLTDGWIIEKEELAQLMGWSHRLPDDLLPYYKPRYAGEILGLS
jgi:hypothetical protein